MVRESMPRAGARVAVVALVAAAAGCVQPSEPAAGPAVGEGAAALRGLVPPPDPAPFQCGGLTSVECPANAGGKPRYECVDDWRDGCDPEAGGADCGGLCVGAKAVQLCGGAYDPPCAAGDVCVADPSLPCAPPSEGGPACSVGACVLAACDPELPCGDAPTCVGGLLYPTTCGPSNCDAPLGPCDECGPPPPCPMPTPNCHYEGGGCSGGQWSCGTLVCEGPVFP